MYSSNLTKEESDEETSNFNSRLATTNLKIIIDNPEVTMDEVSPDEQDNISDVSEEDCGLEVEVNENEIEFHVNLNKVPESLQNTVLNEKIYLNESLKLESIPPENLNVISDEDLQSVYSSLGITESNFATSVTDLETSKDNLFDKKKLHLFGTDELSTQDIFDYFKDFKPIAVEWINDSSCNVIWKNETHSANALLGMSIPHKEDEEENKMNEDSDKKSKIINFKRKSRQPPLGVRWRKGVRSVKEYQIYMRYMRQTDCKKKGAESRSEYYRKYGNPNYGNIKGLISQSKRERMKSEQISSAVSDLSFEIEKKDDSKRNLISYELEDYSINNLEEFGTDKIVTRDEIASTPSKTNKEIREKKLRLYSDDLVEGEDNSKMRSDRIKRKQRFEPYESSSKRRTNHRDDDESPDRHKIHKKDPNDLRNKLNGLRSHY